MVVQVSFSWQIASPQILQRVPFPHLGESHPPHPQCGAHVSFLHHDSGQQSSLRQAVFEAKHQYSRTPAEQRHESLPRGPQPYVWQQTAPFPQINLCEPFSKAGARADSPQCDLKYAEPAVHPPKSYQFGGETECCR